MQSINNNAPVKCSKKIIINAPIETVWKTLTNIDNWEHWQKEISNTELNGELKVGSTFQWKTGGAKINSKLHTVKPLEQFGWTGNSFGMTAIHNWAISETNGQTNVLVEESMEGFLAKLLTKTFNKNLEKGMQKWLELLKEECEKQTKKNGI